MNTIRPLAFAFALAVGARPAFAQDATQPETPEATPPAEPAPAEPTPAEPTPVEPAPTTPALPEQPAAAEPAPEPTAGQEEPAAAGAEPRRPHPKRGVGGHELIFPTRVESAIVATYVGIRGRVAFETAPDVPTEIGTRTVETITLAEALDLGLALTDWLGIFVTGAGRSLIGTNVPGFLFQGLTYDFGGSAGGILRLFESETTGTQLSLLGRFSYLRGQVASLLPIFQIESARVAIREILIGSLRQSIYSPIETMRYGGALALAQGFGPLFGVQLSTALGGGSSTIEPYDINAGVRNTFDTSGVTYDFGIAPSVDFRTLRVPVAVQGELVLSRGPSAPILAGEQRGFDTVGYALLGVYYSGRANLQLGLVGGVRLAADPIVSLQGVSGTPTLGTGDLVLRYIW